MKDKTVIGVICLYSIQKYNILETEKISQDLRTASLKNDHKRKHRTGFGAFSQPNTEVAYGIMVEKKEKHDDTNI
ncbi:TPA: hypothetical protein ACHVGK_000303 [Streptococcus suis]